MRNKKNAFTLIELLAVIVILAVILVISIPKILNVIDETKEDAFKSSTEMIISTAEKNYVIDKVKGEITNPTCENTVKLNKEDYSNCVISFDEEGNATVELEGSGKFDGLTCSGTKNDVVCESIEKIKVYEETILNGAYPNLDKGMIPVTIANDGKVTTVDEKSSNWYSYQNKKWANVVLVKEIGTKTRDYYLKNDNVEVNQDDILAYFVWVPRYKYKLFNVEGTSGTTENKIEIIFENKSTKKSNGTKNGEYLTAPGFTFGSKELNGLWVSKFDTTGTSDNPTILPNKVILTNQNISDEFITSLKFGGGSYNNGTYTYKGTNNYGLNMGSHMMKNSEWATLQYLTNSIYGRCDSTSCEEVMRNNYFSGSSSNPVLKSGYGAVNVATIGWSSSSSSTNEFGSDDTITKPYNTTVGYKASTTGNISGIYDLSGGAGKWTMGLQKDSNNNLYIIDSGFNGLYHRGRNNITGGIEMPSSKYYDAYDFENDSMLGHGIFETKKWYGDYAYFLSYGSWFGRSGGADDGSEGGLFYFSTNGGYASSWYSFRVVLG